MFGEGGCPFPPWLAALLLGREGREHSLTERTCEELSGERAAARHESRTDSHRVCVCPPPRLLIYGEYCSHMEHAQNTLNQLLASREDFRQKVEVLGASRLGLPIPGCFCPSLASCPFPGKVGTGH